MSQLPDFEGWAIFAKVAERGSFSQAAEELGLAKTTVSKAITRLEERLRTTLLHRTTRKLSLTESGRLSLERAARILADGSTVEADVLEESSVPRGVVRMAVTTGFGVEALAPVLPEFMAAFPEVEVECTFTEERVDVVADGYDLAIQIGLGIDSSLRASRLFSFRRPLVAAPALVERLGPPEHPRDLAHYPAIVPTHVPWATRWEFTHVGGEACEVVVKGAYRLNNASAMLPAMVAGIGVAILPTFFISRELDDGRLVELLPDWHSPAGPVYVVSPPGKVRPARVRVLLDFLRRRFAAQGWAAGIEV